jgi:hypothetical protein
MGASSSKPDVLTDEEIMKDIEGKKGIVDKEMTENLTNLSDILSQFDKNDTQGILEKITKMKDFEGKLPTTVLNRVGKVHKELLDTLDSSLSDDDKKKQLQSNSAISNYIQQHVNQDLDTKMKTYLENPFIKNDPVVKQSMSDVTNSIKTIRGKYKFFEYKYLQMNVFLILFTKHIHTTVKKFIDETAAFYEARDKYHLVLIHNVIKTFQQQLGDETKQLTELDTSAFTETIKQLTQSVMESITKQKSISEKMKQDSLQEILKFLMEREVDFAKDIIKGVEDYKTTHATTLAGEPAYGPNPKPEFFAEAEFKGEKKGYVFKNGEKGNGYYLNTSVTSPTSTKAHDSSTPTVFGPSSPTPTVFGPSRPDFISAANFDGPRPGYQYSNGIKGQGYYLNTRAMQGGFVRGSSSMPQNFFDL